MSADAIFGVTEALRDRLEAARALSEVPGSVFVGPLDDPDASGAALVLFLYRIAPNPSLRNREHRVVSSDASPPIKVYNNSLPLDLYYLVTVGTTAKSSEETPLRALGAVMQMLQAEPDLEPKAPPGKPAMHEVVHVTLEPLTTEEASRIWALFPTANYRTSIAYLATPVWVDPLGVRLTAPPVTDESLFAGGKPSEASL